MIQIIGVCEEINKTTKKRCTYKGKFINLENKIVCGIHNKKNVKSKDKKSVVSNKHADKGSFELSELPNEIICIIVDFCDLKSQIQLSLCCTMMMNMFPQFSTMQDTESISRHIVLTNSNVTKMKLLLKSFNINMLYGDKFAYLAVKHSPNYDVLNFFKNRKKTKSMVYDYICKNENTSVVKRILLEDVDNRYKYLPGAIEEENLEYLGYLFSIDTRLMENSDLCRYAGVMSKINSLRFLHEKGCPWTEVVCRAATRAGSLECLIYAHENGCPWDITSICIVACQTGELECLTYIYEQTRAEEYTLVKQCLTDAVKHGHLNCVKFLHKHSAPYNISLCTTAVRYGRFECLQYLHKKGYRWSATACTAAAEKGNLECLKYLHKNGCTWTKKTYRAAFYCINTNCLKYVKKHGCPVWVQPQLHVRREVTFNNNHDVSILIINNNGYGDDSVREETSSDSNDIEGDVGYIDDNYDSDGYDI